MPVALPSGVFRPTPLLLALLAAACGFDPGDESPMVPPPVYREWWSETEACSGLTGDFDRVNWLVVEGAGFPCSSGTCAGHWEPNHSIYLAGSYTANEMVVRHEMLHDLLNRSGHPDPPFGNGCALTWETWSGDGARLEAADRPPVAF